MIRIILFEDNKNFREAIKEALSYSDKVYLTATFEHANNAIREIKKYEPDVVLMDIEMPGLSGLDALSEINKSCPGTKVMIQTQFEDDHRVFVALCRGAWGYALKSDSFDQIQQALVDVHQGGGYFSPTIAGKVSRFFMTEQFKTIPEYVPLTTRQKEVLAHLVQGLKYQTIADEMFLSYEGVHSHVKNIYKKLHVSSRSQAIIKAIEGKLI